MTRLPEGWTEVALGEVCEIISGATPKTSVESYWGGPISWTTPKDLSDLSGKKYLSDTPRTLSESGLKSCGASVLPPGSVLMSSRAPIGLVAINSIRVATNQGFKSLVPSDLVEPSYLYRWLKAHRPQLEAMGRGATFKEISKSIVARIRLPLPPLDEQRRIAAILDKADDLRAKRRAALAHLDTLAQAIFIDVFGDGLGRPGGTRIDELADIQIGPFGSLLHRADYVEGGRPLVNPKHIVDGRIVPNPSEGVDESAVERLARYQLRRGDVVLGRRGEMGRCAVVNSAEDGYFCGSGSMILRPHRDRIRTRYLAEVMSSAWGRGALERRAKGVTMLNLNAAGVGSLEIPCPSLKTQHRYERAATVIDTNVDSAANSLTQLDGLFASLQFRAFRGDL